MVIPPDADIPPSPTERASAAPTELRVYIPPEIGEWLATKAQSVFKPRNTYVRDLLIALYRKETEAVRRT